MATASEELDEIDRIHDDEPEQAAQRLRALDAAQLPADQLPLLAFLFNHVLGEKFGQWQEACARIGALAERAGTPMAVARHWAASAQLAGDRAVAQRALATLAERSGATTKVCAALASVSALNFSAHPSAHCDEFAQLAREASGFPATQLDKGFAASLNNVTSALLAASLGKPLDDAMRRALVDGAEAARLFWTRAGEWLQHERADYLCAKVALRIGDFASAQTAARRGLALIEANGNDVIERAFLLQPLAAACERSGAAAEAEKLREQSEQLAASMDAAYLKYFREDTNELFGSAAS